jgi:hypothetical protein
MIGIRARQKPHNIPRLMLITRRFQVWLEPLLYQHLSLLTYQKVKQLLQCCEESSLGEKLASMVQTLTICEIDGLSTDIVRLLGVCVGATRVRLSMGMHKDWLLNV